MKMVRLMVNVGLEGTAEHRRSCWKGDSPRAVRWAGHAAHEQRTEASTVLQLVEARPRGGPGLQRR